MITMSIRKIVATCLFVVVIINTAAALELKSVMYEDSSDSSVSGILHPAVERRDERRQYVSIYFGSKTPPNWILSTATTNNEKHIITIKLKDGPYLFAADDYHKFDEERRNVFLSNETLGEPKDWKEEKKLEYLWEIEKLGGQTVAAENARGKPVRIKNVLYGEYLLAGDEAHTIGGNPRVFTGKRGPGQKGINMKWILK